MREKNKKSYEIFLLFIYRSLFLSSNLFVVMFDRFRTRSRWEVGILWLGWNVLLLWKEQYDGMTVDKCWALSSLIFYLFFVFCLSYISSNSNYHGTCTAFLFQHFLLPYFLPYFLCFLCFQTFFVISFFFPYSFILYFVRKQLQRRSFRRCLT